MCVNSGSLLSINQQFIAQDNPYFQINEVKSLDGKYEIDNPFIEKLLKFNILKSQYTNDIKKLKNGDKIIFRILPKSNLKSKHNYPVHIINNSMEPMNKFCDLDLLYSTTDFEIVDTLELIKSNEDMKITRVLVNEDSFRENAKEIYSNAKEKYNKEVKKIYEDAQNTKHQILLENKELESQKAELEKDNIKIKDKISEKDREYKEINKKIIKAKIEKQKLMELGILSEEIESAKNKDKLNIQRDEYINYIVKYLGSSYENSLYYNEFTIRNLYTALSTNQLVILSGSPGTGKTSLIEGFCDAIGSNKKIIAVQPSWTETQDLIGFYNPIDKKYISTPFLDFLIEAKNNKDSLYIVCLDEMNLAHVEYYFAEFLSKLESKDREIELYSEEIYIKNKEEIKTQIDFINKKYNIKSKDDIFNIEDTIVFEKYNELKSQYQNLLKYNNKLSIPSNIRFVGTINKDETTKNLSPKVVDRSLIMEVEKYSEEVKKDMLNNIEEYKMKYNKVLNLNSSDFRVARKRIEDNLLLKLMEIAELLEEELQVNLKNRFFRQIEEIIGSKILNEEEILDYIVLTKIIPKINIYIDKEDEQKISRFEELIINLSNSKKAFDKMKSVWEDTEVLTFWR